MSRRCHLISGLLVAALASAAIVALWLPPWQGWHTILPAGSIAPPISLRARGQAAERAAPAQGNERRDGRVVDEEGAAVVGAHVGSTLPNVDVVQTDAAGAFHLDVPAGGAQLYVVARGYADRHVIMPPEAAPLTIVLAKEAALRGRLLHAPIADLLVSICRPPVEPAESAFCVARALVAAGTRAFAFARLAAGAHELLIEQDETTLVRLPLQIRSGEQLDLGAIDSSRTPL